MLFFIYFAPFTIPNSPLNPWTRSMMLLMNIFLQHMSITICRSFLISNVLEPMILLSFSIIGGHVEVTCCFKNSKRNEFCPHDRLFFHIWFLCWRFQWNLFNFKFSFGTYHLLIYGCFHLNFSCKCLISCNNLLHLSLKTPC